MCLPPIEKYHGLLRSAARHSLANNGVEAANEEATHAMGVLCWQYHELSLSAVTAALPSHTERETDQSIPRTLAMDACGIATLASRHHRQQLIVSTDLMDTDFAAGGVNHQVAKYYPCARLANHEPAIGLKPGRPCARAVRLLYITSQPFQPSQPCIGPWYSPYIGPYYSLINKNHF